MDLKDDYHEDGYENESVERPFVTGNLSGGLFVYYRLIRDGIVKA